jgi:hypothetical protein
VSTHFQGNLKHARNLEGNAGTEKRRKKWKDRRIEQAANLLIGGKEKTGLKDWKSLS